MIGCVGRLVNNIVQRLMLQNLRLKCCLSVCLSGLVWSGLSVWCLSICLSVFLSCLVRSNGLKLPSPINGFSSMYLYCHYFLRQCSVNVLMCKE